MELLVALDPTAADPLHTQLERALRADVRAGRLRAGARLPSSRDLAAQLRVSRGVVVEAYAQLAAEGYLATRRGSGTRVAGGLAREQDVAPDGDTPRTAPRWTFHPGQPDLAGFPRAAWAASTRRALQAMPDAALGYGSPRGQRVLRAALAEHLGRTRGVVARPDRMLVTSGFQQGFALVCEVLVRAGATRVAVEDPGWFGHVLALRDAGLEPVPIGVDADGARVQELDGLGVDAVVVTPAHQAPLGGVLAPERRAWLLPWAQRTGALIVEDDYDAEYRYDREPVGALQGVAPELVVYAGTSSKILAPGLRLGWLVTPAALSPPLAAAKSAADLGTPILGQLALADFLARGELDRHLRRMRRRYRARRDALLRALGDHVPQARIQGVAAGLHAVALFDDEAVDEAALARDAAARGIELHGLGLNRLRPGPPGLVLGYAAMPEPAITAAVAELGRLLRT